MLIKRAILTSATLSLLLLGAACSSDNNDDAGSADLGGGQQDMGGVDMGPDPADMGPALDMGANDAGPVNDMGPGDTGPGLDMSAPDMSGPDMGGVDTGPGPDMGGADMGGADMGDPGDTGPDPDIGPDPDMGPGPDMGPPDMGQPDMGNMPQVCNENFEQADACGGNLDGTWQYTEACGTPLQIQNVAMFCPGVTLGATVHNTAGSALVISGGTYSLNLNDQVTTNATIQFTGSGGAATICGVSTMGLPPCTFFEMIAANSLNPLVPTCTEVGSTCECQATGTYITNESGTITFNNGLAVTTDNGTLIQHEYYYCESGNQAQYREREFGLVNGTGPSYIIQR